MKDVIVLKSTEVHTRTHTHTVTHSDTHSDTHIVDTLTNSDTHMRTRAKPHCCDSLLGATTRRNEGLERFSRRFSKQSLFQLFFGPISCSGVMCCSLGENLSYLKILRAAGNKAWCFFFFFFCSRPPVAHTQSYRNCFLHCHRGFCGFLVNLSPTTRRRCYLCSFSRKKKKKKKQQQQHRRHSKHMEVCVSFCVCVCAFAKGKKKRQ